MVEGKVALVVESSSIVQRGAVVELVEGYDIVRIGICQGQMSYQPASTVIISKVSNPVGAQNSYMNPAPPVIMMFLTSGSGSNFVLPVNIGASFHTPKSSKNLLDPFVIAGHPQSAIISNSQNIACVGRQNVKLTGKGSVDAVLGGHVGQIDEGERAYRISIQNFLGSLNSGGCCS
jgi:hypothetical protein